MKKLTSMKFNMWFFFTILVMAEMGATVVAAAAITAFIELFLDMPIELPTFVWFLLLCIGIGSGTLALMNWLFFSQITKLSRSMSQVAKGDFTIRLKTGSMIREVQDIYHSFNLMTQELGATEILQTDFVSNVSHEFKTPINAIEGYATLLQDPTQSDEEREKCVEKILFNTRRLSELVGNILLLSKVDNQAIQGGRTTYRLDEQIRQSIVMLEPKWAEKDIDFDVDLESIEYTGNEGMMMHVWNNLIGNAIKFDSQDGYIGMRLLRDAEGKIIFTIEDDGPGIPDEAKNHIFDKFYQSDSSHKAEGNGLGLALVKRILDSCGGTVEVENVATGGCRFIVTLPEVKETGKNTVEIVAETAQKVVVGTAQKLVRKTGGKS